MLNRLPATLPQAAHLLLYARGMNRTSCHHIAGRQPITRRSFLVLAGATGAGLLAGGCAPLRLAMHLYPDDDQDPGSIATLAGLVLAVIPGLVADDRAMTRVFFDTHYPMVRYTPFLVTDLDRRASKLFPPKRFAELDLTSRMQVIEDGLRADCITSRIYDGAVFLVQVAIYGSIYDDDQGCPLIDFHGRLGLLPPDEQTYPDPGVFLSRTLTPDGNYR